MLLRFRWLTVACLLGLFPAGLSLLRAAEPALVPNAKPAEASAEEQEGTKFTRLSRDANQELVSLDTAIVRYVLPELNKQGIVVDLISAVHVGEKDYYAALNDEFKQYDALLYELVAPEGTRVPKGGKGSGDNPLGMLQGGMKTLLELELQLEQIDYHRDNFVHADMSPEQFQESMKQRGDSFLSMFSRMMEQGGKNPGKLGDENQLGQLFAAMFSPDRSTVLKRLLAEQMEDLDTAMSVIDGPNGSTIVTDRNQVALEVLVEQIGAGKKKLGIFYGAGHMPDLEKHLVADFDAKLKEQRWLKAWNLESKTKKPAPAKPQVESAPQGT